MTESLSRGTVVRWVTRDRITGQVRRTVMSRTRSTPFRIERPDGSAVECVTLECNRLVPVSELTIDDELATQVPAPKAPSSASKARSSAPKAPSSVPNNRSSASKARSSAPNHRSSPAPEPQRTVRDAHRTVDDYQCNVLAVDFLNLLVRAYHAGRPTDVHAIVSMFRTLAAAVFTLRPRHLVFALDGGHAHRSKLLPDYKAHRPPSDELLVKQRELAERAIDAVGLQAVRVDGFEADDVVASLVERFTGVVICSSDKDLLSLSGQARVYHPWSGGKFVDCQEKLGVAPSQVTDYLALCGDSSDGIPGVKGIGPKNAVKLLQDHNSLEAILVAARLGQIKGAVGRKLHEQSADAMLCRDVVELRSQLPVPELQNWSPRPGWQQTLQSMGLRHVAGSLESMLPILNAEDTPPDEEALSASTGKDELGRRTAGVSAGNPESPAAMAPVTRSISEPIRQGLTWRDRWKDDTAVLITSWEAGRTAAARNRHDNPWRPGTAQHEAWQQGCDGQDLHVLPSVSTSSTTDTPVCAPKRTPQLTLF